MKVEKSRRKELFKWLVDQGPEWLVVNDILVNVKKIAVCHPIQHGNVLDGTILESFFTG